MIRRLVSWLRRRPSGGETGPAIGEAVNPHMEHSGMTYRGLKLCPACIWVLDDAGDMQEVIDCRTGNTFKWKGE